MLPTSIEPAADVVIGLGCSLGDRTHRLALTVRRLHAHPAIQVVRCSRLYRTPPLQGGTARGWFANAVVHAQTTLRPLQMLAVVRQLEFQAGRRRARHWGDRTLDLDLLLFGDEVRDDPELRLPHPGIRDRAFVLTPLLEILPNACHPATGRPYGDAPAPTPRAQPFAILPRL